ncbi:glycosyltransferase family 4 protein [Desulfogranum marinum]|uniref:glycosyltransferase family 4 protein n=1 Tax=Desulfogranum marinum TaxID=453220 RepID=UPI0019665808|nr:glycosyltransferase family 4 protein [Desulfogranum marinum]MBM9515139.1 glycosyltransferase family 4 protein [Desulfogranum marinum]
MKIVYFNYLYDIDGVSIGPKVKTLELFSEFEKLGHEVKIYWLNRQATKEISTTPSEKQTIKKKLSKYLHEPKQILVNLKYFWKEKQIVEHENPDLIITRIDPYRISSLFVSKLKNLPIIVELDSPFVYEMLKFQPHYKANEKLLNYIQRENINKSNLTFTVSDEIKYSFKNHNVDLNKIKVIYNGVNTKKFNPDINTDNLKKKYGLNNSVVIGFLGTFQLFHGIDNLISLIEKTVSQDKTVKFLMVGAGGPMKDMLEQSIKEKGCVDNVIFTGSVDYDQIPAHICCMDLVLAPYPDLDFFYYSPLKIFEYMACGKPVVASALGQINDLIEDGKTGFLCKPGNVEEMYKRIYELISNSELRKSMGRNARESIIERHSWQKKAEQLSTLCENVVSGRQD